MVDFSLKWFGIPNTEIIAFWKKLEELPKPAKFHHEGWSYCNCFNCQSKRRKELYDKLTKCSRS